MATIPWIYENSLWSWETSLAWPLDEPNLPKGYRYPRGRSFWAFALLWLSHLIWCFWCLTGNSHPLCTQLSPLHQLHLWLCLRVFSAARKCSLCIATQVMSPRLTWISWSIKHTGDLIPCQWIEEPHNYSLFQIPAANRAELGEHEKEHPMVTTKTGPGHNPLNSCLLPAKISAPPGAFPSQ